MADERTTEAPAPPRRLTRSREQRVIAGVAGGLGEYFGIDPVVFRIGFVAVTLLGGSGILLYAIGWLVIPEEGRHRSIGQAAVRRGVSGPAVGVVLLIIAGFILVHEAFDFGIGRSTLALVLLGLGAALLWSTRSEVSGGLDEDVTTASSGTPVGAPAEAAAPQPAAVPPPPAAPPPPVPPPVPPPARPRRARSVLGRGTLAVILLVAGAMGLADASEGIDIGPEGYLAAALIVTGAGLVVGAWWGRARWLILLGAFLALSLGAAAKFDVPLRGGFGERFHRPTDFSEVDRNYRLFAGEMHLDFSEVDFPRGVTEIDASVAFGELHVRIPQDVTVIVTAEAHAGEVHVLGESDQGLGSEARRMVRGPRGSGTVRLDLEVGGGEIEVRRGAA